MKAAFIRRTGEPEVIEYGDLPDPIPSPGEVRIQVLATSVNPIDTYIRSGAVSAPLRFPYVVGADFAGVVESIGAGCTRFRPGDRVWGSNQGMMGRQGATAELICVDECWAYPLPVGVGFEEAAAIALVGITAHLGLFQRADLQPGETVYVTGGSGGVGSIVVQMAKARKAKVIAAAGSEAKAELCRRFGADEVILYKRESIGERLSALAPEGIHLWFEVSREPDLDLAVAALAKRGRLVAMAGRTARPAFPLGPFYVKDCSLLGFAMFNAKPDEQRRCAERIVEWLLQGALRANIDRTMSFKEAGAAHRLQENSTLLGSGELQGKIVLTP